MVNKCSGSVTITDLDGNFVRMVKYTSKSDRKNKIDDIKKLYRGRKYYIIISPNIIFNINEPKD